MKLYFRLATVLFFLSYSLFFDVYISIGDESSSSTTPSPSTSSYSTAVTAPNSFLPADQSLSIKKPVSVVQLAEKYSAQISVNESTSVKPTTQPSLINTAQVIASFASLGALAFLLWQNILLQRQTKSLNQSVRSATYQNIVSHYVDINKSLVTSTEIAEAFASFSECNKKYSVQEDRRREWLAWWLLNHYENAYMQYHLGSLPKNMWKGIELDCLRQIKKPYISQLWNNSQEFFSEDFKSFIASKLSNETSSVS